MKSRCASCYTHNISRLPGRDSAASGKDPDRARVELEGYSSGLEFNVAVCSRRRRSARSCTASAVSLAIDEALYSIYPASQKSHCSLAKIQSDRKSSKLFNWHCGLLICFAETLSFFSGTRWTRLYLTPIGLGLAASRGSHAAGRTRDPSRSQVIFDLPTGQAAGNGPQQ